MAAHRYWALQVTARAGSGNGVGLAEIEMRATPGGADQCSGGTASGASSFGLVPANAFDNDDNTIWHDAATGGEKVRISYDFGTAVTVAEVFVRNSPAGATSGLPGVIYGPAACMIQWSDDGSAWHYGGPAVDLGGLGNGGTAVIETVVDDGPLLTLRGETFWSGSPWPSGPVTPRLFGGQFWRDFYDGGAYRVAGTVKIDGSPPTPVRRRVRLYEVLSGRLIRQTWSALDGTFAFEQLRAGEYLVVSDDHTRTYNAVVADRVAAVP